MKFIFVSVVFIILIFKTISYCVELQLTETFPYILTFVFSLFAVIDYVEKSISRIQLYC